MDFKKFATVSKIKMVYKACTYYELIEKREVPSTECTKIEVYRY